MPVNKEAYIRYRIIDECLRNKHKPYPSMDDIIEICEEKLGKSFSESTIQKDIKSMKEDSLLGYNAPIKFHRGEMGYYYTDPNFTIAAVPLNESDLQAIEFAASTLQQYEGIKLFSEFSFAVNKIFDAINISSVLNESEVDEVIQFEKTPDTKGSEHLGQILEAIKNRNLISFDYQPFITDVVKNRVLAPYLLKQYRHRWYLIAIENEKVRTFGLDRVNNLSTEKKKFKPDFSFDPKTYFNHAYGITTFVGEPEEVILCFSTGQGKYIKTQPLHETQKVLIDDDSELRISINVGITIELVMDILSFGERVNVLQPKSLQKTIKDHLDKATNQYE